MACQGCGRHGDNRLCCPTCIEYGRTSFFCGQECFTSNWKVHSALHDHLKKKQEMGAAPAASGGGRPAPSPLPRVEDRGRAGIGGSAIAGGASLAPKRQPAVLPSATKEAPKKDGGVPGASAANALGSMFTAAATMFGNAANTQKTAPPRDDPAGKARLRSRSPAPRTMGAAAPGVGKPKSQMQMGLCALALFTVLGGCFLYREHQRYGDDERIVVQQFVGDAEEIKTQESLAPQAIASSAVNAESMIDQAREKDVNALRVEVSSLRELVDRHDKMLRYVMDRYVEKGTVPGSVTAAAGAAFGRPALPPGVVPHEVNLSAPEFVSRSGDGSEFDFRVQDSASAARRNELFKKRKGGSSDGMSGFSQPGLEALSEGASEPPKLDPMFSNVPEFRVGAVSNEAPASKSQGSLGLMFPG